MELYTVRNLGKSGMFLSYILTDQAEVVGDFIKYYLKGSYIESRLIVATNFSVVDLNDLNAESLLRVYERFRNKLSELMYYRKPEKFDYACALSAATEEIWNKIKDDGYKRIFIKNKSENI
jgi:hypothetical protein